MQLAALSLGAGVPEGEFAGTIAEVHTRACLLAADDGTLLTLATAELGALPRGITLAAPPGFSFRAVLATGAAAASRGGVLRIAGGGLAVDLRGARPWRSDLGALRLDLGRDATLAAWRAAAASVAADGRANGLFAMAGGAIGALTEATRAGDADAAGRALARLVGLGAGRTPAGDDYLVGFLAGLLAGGRAAGIVASVQQQVRGLAARTNRVSRLYLDAAATGEVSQRLHDVAAAIAAGGDRASVERAVAAALAIGHDSGAAGVLGLLHGCAAPVQQVRP